MSDQGHPFRKSVQSRTAPLKEFTVGAPQFEAQNNPANLPGNAPVFSTPSQTPLTQPMPTMTLEEARAASAASRTSQDRIGSLSKQRIELLAGIGRLTKDVVVGGYTFSLRTLKSREMQEATLAAIPGSKTDLEVSYNSRRQQLARAIVKIDNTPINEVLGSDDIDTCLDMIDNLEETVVNTLTNELAKLHTESKRGISTQADVEEVAADLKK